MIDPRTEALNPEKGDNYDNLSDADLLKTLADVREANGRINMEIERRFQERDTDTIETDAHVATQRTDTVKYELSPNQLESYRLARENGDWEECKRIENSARVIGQPYVSLKTKTTVK